MANSNGKITAPVGVDSDIAPVLGVASYDLGYLCRSDNVNIYSKYKPVRASVVAEMTDAQFKAADWGYSIPGTVTSQELMAGMAGTATPDEWLAPDSDCRALRFGWWYMRPKGGDTSPFRALDFNGYNHNANGLFNATLSTSVITRTTSVNGTLEAALYLESSSFDLTDFGSLSGKYLAAGIAKSGSTVMKFKTHTDTDYKNAIGFTISELNTILTTSYGTYNVYLFMTSGAGQNISSANPNYLSRLFDCIGLPVPMLQFTYKYQAATSMFRIEINITLVTRNRITFDVSATNTQATSANIIGANLKFKYVSKTAYDLTSSYESNILSPSVSIGTVNVPGGSTTKISTDNYLTNTSYHYIGSPYYLSMTAYYPDSTGAQAESGYSNEYYFE